MPNRPPHSRENVTRLDALHFAADDATVVPSILTRNAT